MANHVDESCLAALVDVAAAVAEALADVEEGTSPSALATPPRRVLSIAQIWRMPETTEGRSSELASRNDVWFVWIKLERR